jgi:hypothetical protein
MSDCWGMTNGRDRELRTTSELRWIRFQIDMVLSGREVCPLSAAEQARYDRLCRLEVTLLAVPAD